VKGSRLHSHWPAPSTADLPVGALDSGSEAHGYRTEPDHTGREQRINLSRTADFYRKGSKQLFGQQDAGLPPRETRVILCFLKATGLGIAPY
jgi:hypothetical protein